jgi:nitroreductase
VESKDRQSLNTILEAARWAVSADNGQPWKFFWRESRLILALDLNRGSSFFDGRLYAPYLGFGSLIENLCIAARHVGYEPHLELFPHSEASNDRIVASISFTPLASQSSPLFAAINERTTNRRAYSSKTILPDARTALLKSSEGFDDFRILFIDDSDLKNKIAGITAGAEAIRFDFSRKDVHADFFKCLRFSHAQARKTADGLWARCLEVGLPQATALRLLANWRLAAFAALLGAHKAFAHQSIHLLRRTQLIALIINSSRSQLRENDFLAGGRLCQRLWLTATSHHLACQPMAALPLFFVQHAAFGDKGFPGQSGGKIGRLKGEFNRAFNLAEHENLLMVFRLGYAAKPSARSLRRPLSELMISIDHSPLAASGKEYQMQADVL